MKTLLFILCLAGCGSAPILQEGTYVVQLVETMDTCDPSSSDAGSMYWDVIRVGDYYGITHLGNSGTLSCELLGSGNIHCYKEYEAYEGCCKNIITQDALLEPLSDDSFTGTLSAKRITCVGETCALEAVLEGQLDI